MYKGISISRERKYHSGRYCFFLESCHFLRPKNDSWLSSLDIKEMNSLRRPSYNGNHRNESFRAVQGLMDLKKWLKD